MWSSRGISPGELVHRGERFVAVRCLDTLMISCYCSPNVDMSFFLEFMDDIDLILDDEKTRKPCDSILICGDFNTKSAFWGSPITDRRGEILQDWMAQWNFCLINTGRTPTCVRPQGTSFIDTTWASAELSRRIKDWTVREDTESLSDHPYISFRIMRNFTAPREIRTGLPRWNWGSFDVGLFKEALDWRCSNPPAFESVTGLSKWLSRVLTDTCNLTARRMYSRSMRKAIFWWNNSIAEARRTCNRQRRIWTRARRKCSHDLDLLQRQYRVARTDLRRRIKIAKAQAWDSLISSVENDPWGLPYRLVLGRLRNSFSERVSTMRPEVLLKTLATLFPENMERSLLNRWSSFEWRDDFAVSTEEVVDSIRNARRGSGDPAPGPDGIPLSVWKKAPPSLLSCN